MHASNQERFVDPEQIRRQVARISSSPGFFRAPRMQRFLRFVVEGALAGNGRPENLKESVIGVAVFDRTADYDPKSDPVVRVEARRLRAKLEEYYDGSGKGDPLRIEIPKGSYVPVWEWQGAPDPPPESPKKNKWPRAYTVAAGLLVILLTGLALLWFRFPRPSELSRKPAEVLGVNVQSLVVLPFRNLSGLAAQDYLSAGLTDEITTELAKIRSLRVISRTSADRYGTSSKPLPEIARELRVDAVVEGTFVQSANRVRVSAQLIRAATDTHIWAASYQGSDRDLFALQTEVAANIAREIGANLTQTSLRTDSGPSDPGAYDHYLRGRYFWNQRTLQSLEKSITHYRQALQIDPMFAKCYAALGESYVLLSSYGGPAPAEAFTRAREAAERALHIDDTLSEAHTVLAAVKVSYEWDWQGAAAEYKRAIELNPSYPTARHWYALLLARLGRTTEAKTEIRHAVDLDPLSRIINVDAGEVYYLAREPKEALRYLQRVQELDPDFAETHLVLGKVFEQEKDWRRALEEFSLAEKLFSSSPNILALKAHALALAGDRDQAQSIARDLERMSAHRYVSNVDLSLPYSALGDCNKAISTLDKAYRNRDKGLDIIGTDPLFDNCRADPRFQKLLAQTQLK